GGSVRQPAAFCGVFGLKPTYGAVSRYGLVAFASSLDQIGPFARTARDVALLFNEICGRDERDMTSRSDATPIDLESLERGVRGMRRRILLGTYALSAGYYDAYYLRAMKVRTLVRRDFDQALLRADAILLPTTPTPPFKLGEKVDDPLAMYLNDIFSIPASLAGAPAPSFPPRGTPSNPPT